MYLTKRLWREFYGDLLPGDDEEIERIAALWSGPYAWDLKKFYYAVAASSRAQDERRSGTRYRSQLDLFVGYLRPCQVEPTGGILFNTHKFMRLLNQPLLEPPDVAGWPGGSTWVSTKSLLVRHRCLLGISAGNTTVDDELKPLLRHLLFTVPPLSQPAAHLNASRQAREWIMDPSFQVR